MSNIFLGNNNANNLTDGRSNLFVNKIKLNQPPIGKIVCVDQAKELNTRLINESDLSFTIPDAESFVTKIVYDEDKKEIDNDIDALESKTVGLQNVYGATIFNGIDFKTQIENEWYLRIYPTGGPDGDDCRMTLNQLSVNEIDCMFDVKCRDLISSQKITAMNGEMTGFKTSTLEVDDISFPSVGMSLDGLGYLSILGDIGALKTKTNNLSVIGGKSVFNSAVVANLGFEAYSFHFNSGHAGGSLPNGTLHQDFDGSLKFKVGNVSKSIAFTDEVPDNVVFTDEVKEQEMVGPLSLPQLTLGSAAFVQQNIGGKKIIFQDGQPSSKTCKVEPRNGTARNIMTNQNAPFSLNFFNGKQVRVLTNTAGPLMMIYTRVNKPPGLSSTVLRAKANVDVPDEKSTEFWIRSDSAASTPNSDFDFGDDTMEMHYVIAQNNYMVDVTIIPMPPSGGLNWVLIKTEILNV